ncbi:MAG: hypothetical protein U0893_28370 [Chloroflexota bacterium]
MTTIAEKDRPTIRDLLARELVGEVELLLFTRRSSPQFTSGQQDGQSSAETRELLDELVGLSDKLSLTVHDLDADPAAATQLNVALAPTVIIRQRKYSTDRPGDRSSQTTVTPAEKADRAHNGVRFVGLPGGYEFSTMLADIVDVSKGQTSLSEATRAAVRALDQPVHIQVFVTPT